MSEPANRSADRVLGYALRELTPRADAPRDHLDENQLAALAVGSLLEGEREPLLAHLARCDACREVLAILADELPLAADGERATTPHAFARGPRGLRQLGLAAAAAALVAIGLFLFDRSPTPPGASSNWLASAEGLAERHPELFADFVPLDESALRAAPTETLRSGGLRILQPVGRVLQLRPDSAWYGEEEGTELELSVRTLAGEPHWSATTDGTSLPYPAAAPPLAPGVAYSWTLTRHGPLGGTSASAFVEVASDEERARFQRALRWAMVFRVRCALARQPLQLARQRERLRNWYDLDRPSRLGSQGSGVKILRIVTDLGRRLLCRTGGEQAGYNEDHRFLHWLSPEMRSRLQLSAWT